MSAQYCCQGIDQCQLGRTISGCSNNSIDNWINPNATVSIPDHDWNAVWGAQTTQITCQQLEELVSSQKISEGSVLCMDYQSYAASVCLCNTDDLGDVGGGTGSGGGTGDGTSQDCIP
jgi:hypothetical protein